MSMTRFDDKLGKLKPGDRMRAAVNAERLNAMTELLQDVAQGKHLKSGQGLLLSRGAAGVTMRARRRMQVRSPCSHQWRPRIVGAQGANHLVEINSGYFNGVSPLVGLEGEDTLESVPIPPLEMPKTGTSYAYLRADLTLELNLDLNFVIGAEEQQVRIVKMSSLQVNSEAAGVYRRWFLLFTKVDSYFTQHRFWNIGCLVDDDGTATQTPRFHDYVSAS